MSGFRIEKDLLGERQVNAGALYGIHTLRAVENFPLSERSIPKPLIHAYGAVKLACARTNHELGTWDDETFLAIEHACIELMEGNLDGHIVVDALQGGAGTSTNMNVNEVIANRAIQIRGGIPGEYKKIHPLEDINLHQSTNDTYPTALKVAAVFELQHLERGLVALFEAFQRKEKEFAHVVKVGRTEMQDAVLTTLGREMAAYAEALSRDRWRVYKCEERLRVVNLGGTAIGTGISAPRQFIFRATEHLRDITGIGLARAENLIDATQNADVFVEVSGILKACAATLFKISSDLRLLSSGPDAGFGEISLPPRQAGSSIMPGKVNPVIPEAVSQATLMVMGNDQALTHACALGNLELNAFMPLIAESLLTNIHLLAQSCLILRTFCVEGITANEERCRQHVDNSTAAITALVERIGYGNAQEAAYAATRECRSIRDIVLERGFVTPGEYDELISPEYVTRLGSTGGKA